MKTQAERLAASIGAHVMKDEMVSPVADLTVLIGRDFSRWLVSISFLVQKNIQTKSDYLAVLAAQAAAEKLGFETIVIDVGEVIAAWFCGVSIRGDKTIKSVRAV